MVIPKLQAVKFKPAGVLSAAIKAIKVNNRNEGFGETVSLGLKGCDSKTTVFDMKLEKYIT